MSLGSQLYDLTQKSPLARRMAHAAEALLFGTRIRKTFASFLLDQHHRSAFRRKWVWWNYGEPHFTDHRDTFWRLYQGDMGEGVYSLARGFHAAELVTKGAQVLDLGCGDGGYTKRFLAPRAAHVDAVDLEQCAIDAATKNNAAPNISYSTLDAVKEPLPTGHYDLIVMDGVLGHVTRDDGALVLSKIKNALSSTGVFCGSESLGHEGHDHLQFFENEAALNQTLSSHFPSVTIKVSEYKSGTITRIEAYWECRR